MKKEKYMLTRISRPRPKRLRLAFFFRLMLGLMFAFHGCGLADV